MSKSGDDHGSEERQPQAGDEAALSARLRELGDRLQTRRVSAPPSGPRAGGGSDRGVGQAMRLASEFVAGILLGAAIGWLIDSWFGTTPWGLIGFVLLGFAAGALNAMRAAGLAPEPPGRNRPGSPPGDGKSGPRPPE